jgi:hypothetical protein
MTSESVPTLNPKVVKSSSTLDCAPPILSNQRAQGNIKTSASKVNNHGAMLFYTCVIEKNPQTFAIVRHSNPIVT